MIFSAAKYVIIGLVVAAFVLVFGQPSTTPRAGAVGEVDGQSISRDVFELFRQQQAELADQFLEAGWDQDRVRDLIDQRTLDTLIQRQVLVQEGFALGLEVSEAEIAQAIRANPGFHTEGRFDRELFERFLARSEFENERTYTELVREDLMIAKLRRTFESPLRVARAAALEKLRRDRTELRLRVAAARQNDFRAGLAPAEAEIEAFAAEHAKEVEEAYAARRGEFQRPARVRVAQILFTGEQALERAQAARAELDAGADFAALARERSQDEASKAAGGDLGFISRGEMLPAFEEAAFNASPGEVAGPVETENGVHLLRVAELQPALDRSLDDARLELARELFLDEASRKAAEAAATAMATALGRGDEFVKAAEEAGLRLEETPRFKLSDPLVPGIGRPPGLREAAFALRVDDPPPARVFAGGGDFFLIALLERHEPAPDELESEVDATREQLVQASRRDLMREWTSARIAELEQAQRIRRFPLYEN